MTFPSCLNYPEEAASFPCSSSIVGLRSQVLVKNYTRTKVEAALLINAISPFIVDILEQRFCFINALYKPSCMSRVVPYDIKTYIDTVMDPNSLFYQDLCFEFQSCS